MGNVSSHAAGRSSVTAGKSRVVAVLGTQWGDEGKGKLVDYFAGGFDYVCRGNGGANAGHTIVVGDEKHIFSHLPSGLLHDTPVAVLGNGTVINVPTLMKEIEALEAKGLSVRGRIKVSLEAHLIMEYHKELDALQEQRKGDKKIGTTCRGIGPCYTDKVSRIGIRVSELLHPESLAQKLERNARLLSERYRTDLDWKFEYDQLMAYREQFLPLVTDTVMLLDEALRAGKSILIEGAQGFHLDPDHGTYPYVTSSTITLGGVCNGLGLSPMAVTEVIGATKAYTSRVGKGFFPTELTEKTGQHLRDVGHEYGSVTGRPRRCGWCDVITIRRAVAVNGLTSLNLTKLDVLTGLDEIKVATGYTVDGEKLDYVPTLTAQQEGLKIAYETYPGWKEDISEVRSFTDLPATAQAFVLNLQELIGCPVSSIGVGPDRQALIFL